MARIFFADDEDYILNMLKAAASAAGYEIVGCASSPQDAEQQLVALGDTIDVAILDGKMPNEGDGAGLAQTIRCLFPGTRVLSFAGQKETFGDINIPKPDTRALLEALNRLCLVP